MKAFRIHILVAMLLSLIALCMSSPGQEVEESDPLRKAQTLFDAGRYDEALESAKTAEELYPERAETWNLLGRIYLAQGASIDRFTGFAGLLRRDLLGEAEEAFRRALAAEPDGIDARNHLAFTLFLLKNFPAAGDQILKALEQEPGNAYANYLAGEIDLQKEETSSAIPRFLKALDSDPGFVDARAGLVRAYLEQNRFEEAGRETVNILQQLPDLPQALQLAYNVYESRDLLNEAVNLYESMLEVAPERADIRFQLGTVLFRLGREEDARAAFDGVLLVDPAHAGALYYQGALCIRQGRLDDARRVLEKAADLDGDFVPHIHYLLHSIALKWADERGPDACLEILDFILARNPLDTDVLANKAITLSRWGRRDEADRAYKELLALDPWDSSVLNNFALHLMGTGREHSAVDMLEKAASLDGNLDALENLGAYYYYKYYTMENMEKAAPYFKRVLEKEPERTRSLVLYHRIIMDWSANRD